MIAQVASYLLFTILITYSHWKLHADKTITYPGFPWILLYVVYFSSVFILVSRLSVKVFSWKLILLLLHIDPWCVPHNWDGRRNERYSFHTWRWRWVCVCCFPPYSFLYKVYFYLLDTIPLFLASGCYAILWPGRWFEELEDRAMGQKPNVPLQNWNNYNNYNYSYQPQPAYNQAYNQA